MFTKAGDKQAFTDAILELCRNREMCRKYGENGRKFVMENLTREIGTQKYKECGERLVWLSRNADK